MSIARAISNKYFFGFLDIDQTFPGFQFGFKIGVVQPSVPDKVDSPTQYLLQSCDHGKQVVEFFVGGKAGIVELIQKINVGVVRKVLG